jgi:ribonuclease HI
MNTRKFTAYFDGCCEPVNPDGTMGFGAVIFENNKVIWRAAGISEPDDAHGGTSCNVAEYTGLLTLLDYFLEHGLADAEIAICGDSKLVIEQMSGRWRIGEGLYVQAARQAERMVVQFKHITFHWIPRDRNRLADELSKLELIRAGVRISARSTKTAQHRSRVA